MSSQTATNEAEFFGGMSVELSKTSSKGVAWVAGTLLVVFIFVVLVGLAVWMGKKEEVRQSVSLVVLGSNLNSQDNPGESLSGYAPYSKNASSLVTPKLCAGTPGAVFAGRRCDCITGYWGPSCNLPAFAAGYYSAGQANGVSLHSTGSFSVPALSFSPDAHSCTDYCTARDDCAGVAYSGGICSLLSRVDVPIGSSLNWSPDSPGNLYFKSGRWPTFYGQVWIAAFPGVVPPRPWLVNEWTTRLTNGTNQPNFINLRPATLKKIFFYPTFEANPSGYLGVFSTRPFDQPQAAYQAGLESPSPDFYISRGPLQLPSQWKYVSPLYVMYLYQ